MIREIRKVYNKYKSYDYIDPDFSNYQIKSTNEFEELYDGICWDFVVAIANELNMIFLINAIFQKYRKRIKL